MVASKLTVVVEKGRGGAVVFVAGAAVVLRKDHVRVLWVAAHPGLPNRAGVVEQDVLVPGDKVPHLQKGLGVGGGVKGVAWERALRAKKKVWAPARARGSSPRSFASGCEHEGVKNARSGSFVRRRGAR